MVRLGIIGCSSIARRRFLPALQQVAGVKLEIIGSRDPSKAERLAYHFDCTQFGTYDDVYRNCSVDLVYISTPPTDHKRQITEALNWSKHVICEKPICMNVSEVHEVLELAKLRNRVVFENYAFLSHSQHKIVKSLLSDLRIGKVRELRISYCYPLPDEGDIRLQPEMGAGVVHDSMGYPIALANYLFGGPISVTESKLSFDTTCQIVMKCEFGLRCNGIIPAKCVVAMGCDYDAKYKITGDLGEIEVLRAFSVNESQKTMIVMRTLGGVEEISVEPENQFAKFINGCLSVLEMGNNNEQELAMLKVRAIMDQVLKGKNAE